MNYWSFGDYLAVGAGAHGKITDAAGAWRYSKPANPLAYMQAMEAVRPAAAAKRLDEDELVFEFHVRKVLADFCGNGTPQT